MPVELDMPSLIRGDAVFICPQTKLPLRAMSLEEAKAAMGSAELVPRSNRGACAVWRDVDADGAVGQCLRVSGRRRHSDSARAGANHAGDPSADVRS